MNYTKRSLPLILMYLLSYTIYCNTEKLPYKSTNSEIISSENGDHGAIVPLDIIIDISAYKSEILLPDTIDLLISIYGGIKFNVFGNYHEDTITGSRQTEKNLFIGVSHIINTTLDPILIPPTRPGGGSARSAKNIVRDELVLLGTYTLYMGAYDTHPGNYTISLALKEVTNNAVVDREFIDFTVYSPYSLGDLEVTHAEILKPFNTIRDQGVLLKTHIRNVRNRDITEKSEVSVYYKKDTDAVLLNKTMIPPLARGQATVVSFFIKSTLYKEIADDYLYIVVDEKDEVLEYSNSNNTLNYRVPKIECNATTIKTYPNPFDDVLNISFRLDNTNTILAIFTMYNRNGIKVYQQGYIYPAGAGNQTIVFKDDNLPSGTYFYSLLIEGVQYYGTILKKLL